MNYQLIDDGKLPELTGDIIACDIETAGLREIALNPFHKDSRVVLLQIKDESDNIYLIDLRVFSPEAYKHIFEDEKIIKIWHNSSFDCTWLKVHYDIDMKNIYDTRLAEQLILGKTLDRNIAKKDKDRIGTKWSASLNYCLKRRGYPDKFEFEQFELNSPFTQNQLLYSARDVEFLHDLREDQLKTIEDLGLDETLTVENRLAEVTYKMRVRGFGFNANLWKELAAQSQKKYDSAMRDIKKLSPGLNVNSPKQVKELIHSLGYTTYQGLTQERKIFKKEGGFNPKYAQIPQIKAILDAKAHFKNISAYGLDYFKYTTKNDDGAFFVHCDYQQIINSGRYSCFNPNLQQLPSVGKHREAFIPNKSGHSFIVADFSGQEIAIMAALSNEQVWLEELRSGGDVHQKTADIVGISRHEAKTINFAVAYGAGPETIASGIGKDIKTASKFIRSWKKAVPKLSLWLEVNAKKAIIKAESRSALGRRRDLSEDEDWRRALIGKNNPIQSTGADMIKLAMVLLDKRGYEVIHTMHDELIVQSTDKKANQTLIAVQTAMADACTFLLGEPLSKGEAVIAKYWKKPE